MNRHLARRAASTLALGVALALGACAALTDPHAPPAAPEPARPIDAAKFYAGRWYEIARTPQKLTDGCVAGTTDYRMEGGALIDRDACRDKTPEGKEKVFAGPVRILDPGRNTKVKVGYKLWGVFTVSRTYWMLDHDDDYRWFIVSDPAFQNISLFTRAARPPENEVKALAARAQALGYDVGRLEYPAQFPPGEGETPAR